jgi:hypothetical protein
VWSDQVPVGPERQVMEMDHHSVRLDDSST